MRTDAFGKGIEADFEGQKFIIPENWDYLLTHEYGDTYMTPPPEDKRVSHHNFIELEIDGKSLI